MTPWRRYRWSAPACRPTPGVAAGMFEALYKAGVNIRMIATSEIRITVLIDEADVDKAMRAAHDQFIED